MREFFYKRGYENTDITTESPKEIEPESSDFVKIRQLASLSKSGYSNEEIILEAKKHDIAPFRMKIAIEYQKNPIRTQVITYLISFIIIGIIYYFYF